MQISAGSAFVCAAVGSHALHSQSYHLWNNKRTFSTSLQVSFNAEVPPDFTFKFNSVFVFYTICNEQSGKLGEKTFFSNCRNLLVRKSTAFVEVRNSLSLSEERR